VKLRTYRIVISRDSKVTITYILADASWGYLLRHSWASCTVVLL
jgi:hypothetical protein